MKEFGGKGGLQETGRWYSEENESWEGDDKQRMIAMAMEKD